MAKDFVRREVLQTLLRLMQDERQIHYSQPVRDEWAEERDEAFKAATAELA